MLSCDLGLAHACSAPLLWHRGFQQRAGGWGEPAVYQSSWGNLIACVLEPRAAQIHKGPRVRLREKEALFFASLYSS